MRILTGFTLGYLIGLCSCAPAPAQYEYRQNAYRWVQATDDHSMYGLFDGMAQVGGYDACRQRYYPIIKGQWGPRGTPPCQLPYIPNENTRFFGGAIVSKISAVERLTINGKEAPKEDLFQGTQSLPADASQPFLTIIGPDVDPGKIALLKDLAGDPCLTRFAGQYRLQVYDPSAAVEPPQNFALRPGFVTSGHPTIYIQAVDGTVIRRWDTYPGAAIVADGLSDALRVPKLPYDPKTDPAGGGVVAWASQVVAKTGVPLTPHAVVALAIAGVGAAGFATRKQFVK